MILSGNEIIREVQNKNIVLEPFSIENINPNSYNYTLNEQIIELKYDINKEKIVKYTHKLTDEGMVLHPGVLYLGVTNEEIGSTKYATSLIGRSSIGRLGMHLQISANLGHTGTSHKWTLEIRVAKKIRIYPNVKIGQVSFWENKGTLSLYNGFYKEINIPHEGFKIKFSE